MSNEAPTDALRLVPVEPTEAMLDAVKPWPEHWPPYGQATVSARAAYDIDRAVLRSNWTHMVAAAPASPLPGGGQLSKNLGELKSPDLDALEKLADRCSFGDPWYTEENLLGRQNFGQFLPQDRAFIAAANPATIKALIAELKEARSTVEELLYAHTDKSIAMAEAFLARNGKGEG